MNLGLVLVMKITMMMIIMMKKKMMNKMMMMMKKRREDHLSVPHNNLFLLGWVAELRWKKF